ncbi:MAG: NfeD family protein [Pseudoclavibacter sp.]
MTVFIIIGAIGLGLLVFSLFFGEVLDVDAGGLLSVPGLAVALVVFGASGAITDSMGLPQFWAYIVAIVIGLIAYVGSALLVRNLSRSSDGVPRDVTGDTGTAMSRITNSSGEVALDGSHEIERRLAFADGEIEQGARIRVVQHLGSRVKVERESN